MSDTSIRGFNGRSRKILRQRQRVARRGGELDIGPDGLLTVRPRRGGSGLPFRGLFLLAALFFGAKALMLAEEGAQAYGEGLVRLAGGGTAGQAAAWVMQPDPMSLWLAEIIRLLLG